MTNTVASLRIDIDSTSAPKAAADMEKVAASGAKAEKAVDRLGNESEQVGRQMRTASQGAADMAAAAQRSAEMATRAGTSSRLAAHHVQNLGFQFTDLGVQIASGANPMMAFIQQSGQISGIMSQAGIGVKGLAGEIAGMVSRFTAAHPYLTAFVVVAGAAASAMGLFTATMNHDKKAEIDAFKNSLGLTREELKELGPVGIKAGDVIKGLGMTIEEYLGVKTDKIVKNLKTMMFDAFKAIGGYSMAATAAIYAGFAGTYDAVKAIWSKLPAVIGDAAYSAANLVISGLNYLLQKGTAYINAWSGLINAVLGKIPGFEGTQIGTLTAPQISEIANPFKGAAASMAGEVAGAYSKRFGEAMAGQKGFFEKVGENSFKAMKDRVTKDAREKGLLDDDAAGAAGRRAGKKAGEEFGKGFMQALQESLILYQADIAKALAETLEASQAADWDKFIKGVNSARDKAQDAMRDAGEANAYWNEQLSLTIGYLGQIGGFAGSIGSVATVLQGLSTGNFAGLPGKFGGLIGLLNQTDGGKVLLDGFQGILNKTFGGSGVFAQTLGSVLSGAATGAVIGSVVGNSKGNQIGGAIGGALGQIGGTALGSTIGGTLGSVVPVIGTIIGSILGSLVGGLFKGGPDWATTNLRSGSAGGNKDEQRQGVMQAADAFDQAMKKIASSLNTTIGEFNTSIGLHNGNWHVSTIGREGTLRTTRGWQDVTDFGPDAEAALTAAIRDAIGDGAFQGLSDGVKKALMAGDLETQLQKVAAFMSVPDELRRMKDPQGADLSDLEKEVANLRDIYAEMGASTAEYAQLEELFQLKRAEIMGEGANDALEIERQRRAMEITLMELSGDSLGALAAARALERAELDPTLHALYDEIAAKQDSIKASQDLAAAQAEAANLAQQRANLEIQLMNAQGDAAGALAAQRALDVAATTEANRSIVLAIHAAQDLAAARQAEAEAASQAASRAATTRNLEIALMEAQGDAQGALNAKRQLEVDAASEADRAIVRMIHAAQDASTAAAEAASAQDRLAQAQRDAAAAAKAQADAIGTEATEIVSIIHRMMELSGRGAEVTAAQRQGALGEISNPYLRELTQQLWAMEDAAKAAAAQSERAAKWVKERRDLQQQLMELSGDSLGAVMSIRNELLAALEPANREMQKQVWLLQDQKKAAEEAAAAAEALAAQQRRAAEEAARAAEEAERARIQAIDTARNTLAQSYDRESNALRDTIERFSAFSKELREFKSSLSGVTGLGDQYRRAQGLFVDTASAARMGDADALGKLSGVAKEFLDASMSRASSALEYNRDVARVKRALDDAIGASGEVIDYAITQQAALDRLVEGQDLGNDVALSTLEALNQLNILLGGEVVPAPATVPVVTSGAPIPASGTTPQTSNGNAPATLEAMNAQLVQVNGNLTTIKSYLRGWNRGTSISVSFDTTPTVAVA